MKLKKILFLLLIFFNFLYSSDIDTYISMRKKQYNTKIIIDYKNKLMWQDDNQVKNIKLRWSEAKVYCKNLNLAGHYNWRLPSKDELLTIVDIGKHNPALISSFKHRATLFYWTNTSYELDISLAWFVNFYYGKDYFYSKSSKYYVRCVRNEM